MRDMKCTTGVAFLLLLVLPAAGYAQSVFEGTWKPVPHTFHTTARLTQVLKDGRFRFASFANGSELAVKADGDFHRLKGIPYFNQAAVHVVDGHTVTLTGRKDGKNVVNNILRVNKDGRILQLTMQKLAADGHVAGTRHQRFARTSNGPAGSHAISGSWRPLAGEGIVNTYHLDGNVLQARDSAGHRYKARLGGESVVLHGAQGERVAVSTLGPRALRETFSRNGKVTDIYLTFVAPDGNTACTVELNLPGGDTSSWIVRKQP